MRISNRSVGSARLSVLTLGATAVALGALVGCSSLLGLDDMKVSDETTSKGGRSEDQAGAAGEDQQGSSGESGSAGRGSGGSAGEGSGGDAGESTAGSGQGGRTGSGGRASGGRTGSGGSSSVGGRTGTGGRTGAGGRTGTGGDEVAGRSSTEGGRSDGGDGGTGDIAGSTSVELGGAAGSMVVPSCEGEPSESCGNCNYGMRTRGGFTDGTWSDWSDCVEAEDSCAPTTEVTCGAVGTQTCDSSCSWGGCECPAAEVGVGCGACGQGTDVQTCVAGELTSSGVCDGEQFCDYLETFDDNSRGWYAATEYSPDSTVLMTRDVADGVYTMALVNSNEQQEYYTCSAAPLGGKGTLNDMKVIATVNLTAGGLAAVAARLAQGQGGYLFLVGDPDISNLCAIAYVDASNVLTILSKCSTYLVPGDDTQLGLSAQGSTLTATIDGVVVATADDGTLSDGYPGACVWSLAGSTAMATFDDFTVYSEGVSPL
jgi:hypothetical protein